MDYVGAILADAHVHGLDVATLSDIPSYGRSFLNLWTEAQNLCLSDKKILSHFWRWEYARPAAWGRTDFIYSKLSRLLRQRAVWRRTGDSLFPWEIASGRSRLRVRLNDYPDEVMYTLFRADLPVGDFHDWPDTWDRGDPRVADNVDPASLVARYLRGECEDVWNDLVLLGDAVLRQPFRSPARTVARETMRRARRNLLTIVDRLTALHYRFRTQPLRQCTSAERKLLAKMDLPLSLRAWYEEVGVLDLSGYHRTLCPPVVKAAGIAAPLAMEWPPTKVTATKGADFRIPGDHRHLLFVQFIRLALNWGGFPGWQLYESWPEKQIAALRKDLVPL
jgi:hypothetical protein